MVGEETYNALRGLGGFRNVLAHEYLDINLHEVISWTDRILDILPTWIGEVAAWMDRVQEVRPEDS